MGIVLIHLLFFTIFGWADTGEGSFNLGVENIDLEINYPKDWMDWSQFFISEPDANIKHSGKYSLRIEPGKKITEKSFGCGVIQIPVNFTGKSIELRGFLKYENIQNGFVGLILRMDGIKGLLGFNNMEDKKIQGTSDWTEYSITLDFPDQTKGIYAGAVITGTGRLWVDDLQILVDGKDIQTLTKPIIFKADQDHEFDQDSKIKIFKLNKQKIEDLTVLGLVWGLVKYYHPRMAAGEFQCDYELFRILPKILSTKKKTVRNQILLQWIERLGSFPLAKTQTEPSGKIKMVPDLDWTQNTAQLGTELAQRLKDIINSQHPSQHYYIDQFSNGGPHFTSERAYENQVYPDAGFRLLALYRYWNIIQYYFPYRYAISGDWKSTLSEFIPKFIKAPDAEKYLWVTQELMARIGDSHAGILPENPSWIKCQGQYAAPIKIELIESQAMVTEYYDEILGLKTGLKRGDIISQINRKSVSRIIEELTPFTNGSNRGSQVRNILRNLIRSKQTPIQVQYDRNGQKKELQLDGIDALLNRKLFREYEKQKIGWKLITQEIGYVFPGSISCRDLPQIIDEIKKTKGLIIDFRCYPKDMIIYDLCTFLNSKPTPFVRFSICSIPTPGLFTFTDPPWLIGEDNPNSYPGKVVILVNENTQSSAEFQVMGFQTAHRAMVIGSPTSGADGNVSEVILPGGIKSWITGIGIYYPDYRETQRVGIIPDIELKPTIKGIRENRDELMEAALKIINQEANPADEKKK